MSTQLAAHGGEPVRRTVLPYGQQWINDEDIEAVVRVLKSDYLTQGPKIYDFEKKVAELAEAQYAVAFCNGTAALHGACFVAGIGKGDEVITTSMTFAASSNCVLYQGGTPVFADIDPATYLIDLEQVEKLRTSRTKAIIPVDFTGQPVDMMRFQEYARANGLVMIQDAAHSFGASYDGKPVGSVADMTMFSFHPVKPVTTGEGGVIVTNNEDYYRKLVLFRSHGITRDTNMLMRESEGPWYYEMQELGYNYRITDIQAALGESQCARLPALIVRRQELAKAYDQALKDLQTKGLIELPGVDSKASPGWHLYIIRLNLERLKVARKEVFEAMRAENIGVNVHYIPVHLQPYYQKLGYQQGQCPVTEKAYNAFITLPLYPKMSNNDIEDVVAALNKVLLFYDKS